MASRRDFRPVLNRIAIPTLVIAGADDVITPPATVQAMAAMIPSAELAIIPGAGHLAPLEAPDLVNTAIRKLLRRATHDPGADTGNYSRPV